MGVFGKKFCIDYSYNWNLHFQEGEVSWKRVETKLSLLQILSAELQIY